MDTDLPRHAEEVADVLTNLLATFDPSASPDAQAARLRDGTEAVLRIFGEHGRTDALDLARAAFDDGRDEDADVAEAALVSIAEDVRRATQVMESAGHEVAMFLRNVGPPLAVGGRVLPEIAMLLQQLNAPHREVTAGEVGSELDGSIFGGHHAEALLAAFARRGWRLIGPPSEPEF